MSIDIYFAGSQNKEADTLINKKSFPRLFSYYNDKKGINDFFKENAFSKLFIDSGAFTAWTKGVKINVDEYINFLNEHYDRIYLAGQVDIIAGTPDSVPTAQQQYEASVGTWENYLYMRERLKNPDVLLYTFHIGEDFKFLKQALEWRDSNGNPFPYMALGGTVGKTSPQKIEWFNKCWKIIKNSSHPNVKVHAFGMTSLKILENFPFTSADSTSWILTSAMGSIYSKFGNIFVSSNRKNDPTHYSHLPEEYKKQLTEHITSLGYSMEQLEIDYKARSCYNILYLNEWSKTYNPVYKNDRKKSLF